MTSIQKIKLSEEQRQIIESPIGRPVQVLASAGSGKTRVLTERIRYILENRKNDGVIALTFTNKAANEMRERLSDCPNLEDRVWISTIHSLGQRILSKYSHTIGLPRNLQIFDRDQDRLILFTEALKEQRIDFSELNSRFNQSSHISLENILRGYLAFFSKIKRELIPVEAAEEKFKTTIKKYFELYNAALLTSGGIDYDDILFYAHKIILNQPWITQIYRSKFQHLCVDEAQDLNKSQYSFLKEFCGEDLKSVLMVGDPNQMIFGFNGSSSMFFCDTFKKDFSPTEFHLNKNYRSARKIIKAANLLVRENSSSSVFPIEGRVETSCYDSEGAEAQGIVSIVQELLSSKYHDDIEGQITYDKMVVIARNRFVFKELEKALQKSNIPFHIRKSEGWQEQETRVGKVLDLSIKVKINSNDWIHQENLFEVLQLQPIESLSPDPLSFLANKLELSNEDETKVLAVILREVNGLDENEPNFPKLIKKVRDALDKWLSSQTAKDQEELIKMSIEELNDLGNLWDLFKIKKLGNSLSAFRSALALGQLASSSYGEGLLLSTVHTMKGLEKDIVFLMGMCEGVFPDYRALKSSKKLDEEKNSAFVAVTRARRWLFISYPKERLMPWGDYKVQTPSRYFNIIQANL